MVNLFYPRIILTQAVLKRGRFTPISKLPTCSRFSVLVVCPLCHSERSISLALANRSGHTACISCTNSLFSYIPVRIGDKYGRLTVARIIDRKRSEFECECGTLVIRENNNIRYKSGTKSCGCLRKENITPRLSGKDHPNWKGGISDERGTHMQNSDYKLWRKKVYERDNYTCQKCGQIGKELNAHHILSYSAYPDNRTDLDNGATLCKECHKEYHRQYGRLKHTLDDWHTFLDQIEISGNITR